MQSILLWLKGIDTHMQGKYWHAQVDCRNADPDGIVFVLIPNDKSRGWPWLSTIDTTCVTWERERENELVSKCWSTITGLDCRSPRDQWERPETSDEIKTMYYNYYWLSFYFCHIYTYILLKTLVIFEIFTFNLA
jgi:hypothetical protein